MQRCSGANGNRDVICSLKEATLTNPQSPTFLFGFKVVQNSLLIEGIPYRERFFGSSSHNFDARCDYAIQSGSYHQTSCTWCVNLFFMQVLLGSYGTLPKTSTTARLESRYDQLLPSQTNEFCDKIRATIKPAQSERRQQIKWQLFVQTLLLSQPNKRRVYKIHAGHEKATKHLP